MKPVLPSAMPLETARLQLRQPVEKDADAIIAICSDWEVARRLGRIPHPYLDEHVRFFFNHVVPNAPTWAILWRETLVLIGVVGLAPAPDGQSAELGYYIARDHWGQGIVTEAARSVLEAGFMSYRYRKLTSGYFADNPNSGRVLEKLGFTITGVSKRPCVAEGEEKDSVEVERVP